jgi:hypothetical protein
LSLVSSICGAALAAALLAPSASAATLTGDYQFQGTRASSGPGPALTDIGAGNVFVSDNVMGATRQVLAFPAGTGLQMSPAGLGSGSGTYTEVVTFRFASVTPDYFRILDSTNGTGDSGLYIHEGKLDFYDQDTGTDFESSSALLSPDTYATVAMVSGFPYDAIAYFNGARVAQFFRGYGVIADTLRFFKDDSSEESAGAVSCIRVFNGALSDAEVAAIGASPTCTAPPAVTKKKKCKKKKKKHRGRR